jgi:hypothetical protein
MEENCRKLLAATFYSLPAALFSLRSAQGRSSALPTFFALPQWPGSSWREGVDLELDSPPRWTSAGQSEHPSYLDWMLPGRAGRNLGEGRGARGCLRRPWPASPRAPPLPRPQPAARRSPAPPAPRLYTSSPELRPCRSDPRAAAGDAAGHRAVPAPVALPRTPGR